jgi:hypothetical protein
LHLVMNMHKVCRLTYVHSRDFKDNVILPSIPQVEKSLQRIQSGQSNAMYTLQQSVENKVCMCVCLHTCVCVCSLLQCKVFGVSHDLVILCYHNEYICFL